MATFPKLPNVEIRDTGTPKGRGAFALQAFQLGAVVEVCPVIVFQCPHRGLPKEMQDHVFDWSDLDGTAGNNMQALGLGYGGMYNGDNPANMRYKAVINGAQPLMRFVAVRHIIAGEELTVNYSGKSGAAVSEGNRWFDERGIEPIRARAAVPQGVSIPTGT
jgi:hypothetical protein